MSNHVMHVGIEEPVQRRKEILKIGIYAIQALKDFEIQRKYNKEKTVYRKHFTQVIKDLSNAIEEFKESMPRLHVHHPKEEKEEKIKSKIESVIIKKHGRRAKTHLDKLEDDIADLRGKIASL